MAFAVTPAARLLLLPPTGGPLTTRQASLDATDRRVAPSNEASDAGLRPDPFPSRAASLLPGLLVATRTGLTPAGNDELMLDQAISINHLQLWAHGGSRLKTKTQVAHAPASRETEQRTRDPIRSEAGLLERRSPSKTELSTCSSGVSDCKSRRARQLVDGESSTHLVSDRPVLVAAASDARLVAREVDDADAVEPV